MEDFPIRVRAHAWDLEPHDEWHNPTKVPGALTAAWRGEADSYDQLMSVLANDHAGEWFPALVPAMPFMNEILARGATVGAHAVLHLLIDFVYSFHVFQPDPAAAGRLELAFHGGLRAIQQTLSGVTALDPSDLEATAELVDAISARIEEARDGESLPQSGS